MFCGPNSIATSYSFVASRMWLGCQQQHRSEEHTSELQSQSNLVCRLLLEKKKNRTSTREHNRVLGVSCPVPGQCRLGIHRCTPALVLPAGGYLRLLLLPP